MNAKKGNPSPPTVVLHIVPPNRAPFDYSFRSVSLTIGRSASSDLVLPDQSLSRKHAELCWRDDQLYLVDCQSSNGTFLNAQKVDDSAAVMTGDWFQLSKSTIYLREIHRYAPSQLEDGEASGQHTLLRPVVDGLEAKPTEAVRQVEDLPALKEYAERLRLLNEVHEAATKPMPLIELLELILDSAFGHLNPEMGAIYLRNDEGVFETVAYKSKEKKGKPLNPSQKLISEVAEKGMAARVFDTQADQRFSGSDSMVISGIRSMVAAPIMDMEKPLGMIVLSSKVVVRQFSEEDLNTLISVAAVASLKIRNARLVEASAQRRVYQRELTIARKIQVSLLPRSLPCPEGYRIEGRNLPSQGVSGDFYQVVRREKDGHLVLMVADVSGKGIAASLLVGSLEALSAAPIEDGLGPDVICEKLTRLLYARTSRERYATLFLAILDPATDRLVYANAGHPAALLIRRDGGCEDLPITGVPIGIFREAAYEACEAQLDPGDTLFIFTDGLTEARNEHEEEYGVHRLSQVCARHTQEPLNQLVAAIDREWEAFAQQSEALDDRTMILLRRLELERKGQPMSLPEESE